MEPWEYAAEPVTRGDSDWVVAIFDEYIRDAMAELLPELLPEIVTDDFRDKLFDRAKKKGGGRPPATKWDRFWLELCRRIRFGEYPETPTDLVRAMKAWNEAQGLELHEREIERRVAELCNQPWFDMTR